MKTFESWRVYLFCITFVRLQYRYQVPGTYLDSIPHTYFKRGTGGWKQLFGGTQASSSSPKYMHRMTDPAFWEGFLYSGSHLWHWQMSLRNDAHHLPSEPNFHVRCQTSLLVKHPTTTAALFLSIRSTMTSMQSVIILLLLTSNAAIAFQNHRVSFAIMRNTMREYKKESNDEHHPHLKQGESVFESAINRVLKEDTDCPLLKHRELMSSSSSSSSSSIMAEKHSHEESYRTSIVPSTIDSLPAELVDMASFQNEMKVQARMRVPSFNAQGYKSSLIYDLKHQMTDGTRSSRVQQGVVSLYSNKATLVQGRWKALGARLRLWLTKAYQIVATKSRLLALRLAKVDWSPLIQWIALIMVLHLMCYHDVQPTSLSFHLL